MICVAFERDGLPAAVVLLTKCAVKGFHLLVPLELDDEAAPRPARSNTIGNLRVGTGTLLARRIQHMEQRRCSACEEEATAVKVVYLGAASIARMRESIAY
eukprot:6203991-Pleurochrysis_carterae.AAC.3